MIKKICTLVLLCGMLPTFSFGAFKASPARHCVRKVLKSCRMASPYQRIICAKQVLSKRHYCRQTLSFLTQSDALPLQIVRFGPLRVIYATVLLGADYSDGYFIVTPSMRVVSAQSTSMIHGAKPEYFIVARWDDFPTRIQNHHHGIHLQFHQRVLMGCHACAKLGTADVIYRFTPKGQWLGASLRQYHLTHVQTQTHAKVQ